MHIHVYYMVQYKETNKIQNNRKKHAYACALYGSI